MNSQSCFILDALKAMLNLNMSTNSTKLSNTTEPVWKLLIYDRCGQDIISPLLNVKELRELGVTLHMYVFMAMMSG